MNVPTRAFMPDVGSPATVDLPVNIGIIKAPNGDITLYDAGWKQLSYIHDATGSCCWADLREQMVNIGLRPDAWFGRAGEPSGVGRRTGSGSRGVGQSDQPALAAALPAPVLLRELLRAHARLRRVHLDRRAVRVGRADVGDVVAVARIANKHGVPLVAVRQALAYAERELSIEQLLLREELCTAGP